MSRSDGSCLLRMSGVLRICLGAGKGEHSSRTRANRPDVLGSLSLSSLPSDPPFKIKPPFPRGGRPCEKLCRDNEVNDPTPHVVDSEQEVDDLLTTLRTRGMDVVEGPDPLTDTGREERLEETLEDIDLNPSPGIPEADNDPVAFICERWVPRLCSPAKEK